MPHGHHTPYEKIVVAGGGAEVGLDIDEEGATSALVLFLSYYFQPWVNNLAPPK